MIHTTSFLKMIIAYLIEIVLPLVSLHHPVAAPAMISVLNDAPVSAAVAEPLERGDQALLPHLGAVQGQVGVGGVGAGLNG